MKEKRTEEFENFDKMMGGLLSVPRSELQQKLEEEKREKEKGKERRPSSPEPTTRQRRREK